MTDPLTLAVATAAAGKAVELAGQPVKDGIAALYEKVRGRFRGESGDDGESAPEQVLSGAVADPGDDGRITRLAEVLGRAMEQEPAFAAGVEDALRRAMDADSGFRAEIHNRLQQVRVEATANDHGTSNVFNERVGNVVQIGEVHGGLNIN